MNEKIWRKIAIYDALTRGLVLIMAICIFFFLLHKTLHNLLNMSETMIDGELQPLIFFRESIVFSFSEKKFKAFCRSKAILYEQFPIN